jgi:hypothetical protein
MARTRSDKCLTGIRGLRDTRGSACMYGRGRTRRKVGDVRYCRASALPSGGHFPLDYFMDSRWTLERSVLSTCNRKCVTTAMKTREECLLGSVTSLMRSTTCLTEKGLVSRHRGQRLAGRKSRVTVVFQCTTTTTTQQLFAPRFHYLTETTLYDRGAGPN